MISIHDPPVGREKTEVLCLANTNSKFGNLIMIHFISAGIHRFLAASQLKMALRNGSVSESRSDESINFAMQWTTETMT